MSRLVFVAVDLPNFVQRSRPVLESLRYLDALVFVCIDDFYLSNVWSTKLDTVYALRSGSSSYVFSTPCFLQSRLFYVHLEVHLDPYHLTSRVCDTILGNFEGPQDELDKVEQILNMIIETGSISFSALEKSTTHCTPFSLCPNNSEIFTVREAPE